MKTVKAKNALRAVLTAWALFMDLNLRSGNNYVNLGESLDRDERRGGAGRDGGLSGT